MAVTNIYGNGTSTATAGANTITHYYDRTGIVSATRHNMYMQFADKRSMRQKHGKTFKVSKWEHMYDRAISHKDFAAKGYLTGRDADDVSASLKNAALSEGSGPANQRKIHKITYDTAFSRYGEMIDYTDEVDIFSEDDIQIRYREELGDLAGMRYEDLIQQDMLSTPTVLYSGTATSMATVKEKVSYDLMRKAVQKLVRNRAIKNTSIVLGSTKVDTKTIAKSYYAIIGAEVKADLENCTRGTVKDNGTTEYGYQPLHKYGDAAKAATGEVGAMHETRYIESETAFVYRGKGATATAGDLKAATGGKYDVFPILYPTEGAFATVGLQGLNRIKFNSKKPEIIDGTNPYGTQGFFSYNFFYAGIILKPEALLKVLVAASE